MYGLDGRFPDVIWDGYINPAVADEGKLPATLAICLQDAQSKMLNVDAPNGYNNPNEDMANHRCELALGYPEGSKFMRVICKKWRIEIISD